MPQTRRAVLTALLAQVALGAVLPYSARAESFSVELTDREWRERLSPLAYAVLRNHATERPWTSPLLEEHRSGTFTCAGCALPLFASDTKFESGTGWPSFYAPLAGAIGESSDFDLGYKRTEVHCSRCGGHLGHVFDDGPAPTGLRYCINGVALAFEPKEG